jgi:hypothetical protein
MGMWAEVARWAFNLLVSGVVSWVTANWTYRRAAQQRRIEQIDTALEDYATAGQAYWREDGARPAEERSILQFLDRLSSRVDAYFSNARSADSKLEIDLAIDDLHRLISGDDAQGNAFKSPERAADKNRPGLIRSKAAAIRKTIGGLPLSTKMPFGFF